MTSRVAPHAFRRDLALRVAVALAVFFWIVCTVLIAHAQESPQPTPQPTSQPPVPAAPAPTAASDGEAAAQVAPAGAVELPTTDAPAVAGPEPVPMAAAAPDARATAQPAVAIPAPTAPDRAATAAPDAGDADTASEPTDAEWATAMLQEEKASRQAELDESLGDDEAPEQTSFAWLFVGAGLIVGVGWLMTRFQKQRKSDGATRLRHVQSLRLGNRQHIALVEVADRSLVIGMNAGHIALLCELPNDGSAAVAVNRSMELDAESPTPSNPLARFGLELSDALSRSKPTTPSARPTEARTAPEPTLDEPSPKPAPSTAPADTVGSELDPLVSATPATRLTLSARHRDERRAPHVSGVGNGETNAVLERLNSLRSRTHARPARKGLDGRARSAS